MPGRLSRCGRPGQALRPGVEALEFAGIGHAPALMSYDQFAAVRAFLLR
jgi:hypothetical protein